jgi:hypothetical protein
MEICGAYFKLHTDKDLFDYFQSHYKHFFPKLKDRLGFVRQSANLWQFKAVIWQQIVKQSGQDKANVQVIDTRAATGLHLHSRPGETVVSKRKLIMDIVLQRR